MLSDTFKREALSTAHVELDPASSIHLPFSVSDLPQKKKREEKLIPSASGPLHTGLITHMIVRWILRSLESNSEPRVVRFGHWIDVPIDFALSR